MNIKVVWAFALISVCFVLVAADDNSNNNNNDNDNSNSDNSNSDNSATRFIKWRKRYRRTRRTTTTAPEVNENVDGGISVSITGDGDASVHNNLPTYGVKEVHSKTKVGYAGVAIDDGDLVVKKRVVKRKRVKRRPVIKRKRVKSIYYNSASTPGEQIDSDVAVSVNKRPFYKRKGFAAGFYENDGSTGEASNVYIGPYNAGPAIVKNKNLRISVENNNNEELDEPKPVVIKKNKKKTASISIDADVDDSEVQQKAVVVGKNKFKLNINEDFDEPRPVVIKKFKPKIPSISIDADGVDDEIIHKPVVVGKNKYKVNVEYNQDTDDTDDLPQKPIRVYKQKYVVAKAVPKVVKPIVNIIDDTDETVLVSNNKAVSKGVSLTIQESTPKKIVVPLFAGAPAPAPTVKVAIGGTPAKLLEGPIRQAEISDKAMKAIIAVVTDTAAKNTKIVENRVANLFTFGVDNIGGAFADVKAIKLNNNRAIRDIVLILSNSVDRSFDLTVDGVGGVIRDVGFGKTGAGIFKNTVDCIVGTLKSILWTKLNVLEYIYIIKTQFLTFGLHKPIAVLPKVASKLSVCLNIVKI